MSTTFQSLAGRITTGTANPSNPAIGDWHYNTARNTFMRYDGVQWLGLAFVQTTTSTSTTSTSTSTTSTSTSTTSTSTSTTSTSTSTTSTSTSTSTTSTSTSTSTSTTV